MRMIPPVLSEHTQSTAERRIFALLEKTRLGNGACCVHSLELSQHDYKLCAELDFVIVTRKCVIVLEVKGGGVANRDGIWIFTDRFGHEHRKSEGPFHQAKSGMFALRQRMESQFGSEPVRTLAFGYGVVFPDCDFRERSVEWDSPMVLDASRLRGLTDLAQPVRELIGYWESKHHASADPPQGFHDRLLHFLRPSFERVPSLRNRADALDAAMDALTDEQYSRLDIIQENPRILCSGGAGTGKTFLALEIARRHDALAARVLVVCSGRPLAAFLRSRIRSDKILVAAGDEIKALRSDFDVLIVDEGQDLINLETLDNLDRRLVGGLEKGTWRFFYDANSQAGLLGRFEPDGLALLRSFGAVSAALSLNCRNTNEIVIQTKLLTGSDLGVPSAGAGPPVRYEFYDTLSAQAALVDQYWKELDAGDIAPGDVTIISPVELDESCIRSTRLFKKGRVRRLTEEVALHWPSADLTFSTIPDFKGLENRFILLADIEQPEHLERLRSQLYVGMTRARAGLWMAAHERLREYISSIAETNMPAVITDVDRTTARRS
jgi:hypothetical protein